MEHGTFVSPGIKAQHRKAASRSEKCTEAREKCAIKEAAMNRHTQKDIV
jgi:hypothetical protein